MAILAHDLLEKISKLAEFKVQKMIFPSRLAFGDFVKTDYIPTKQELDTVSNAR